MLLKGTVYLANDYNLISKVLLDPTNSTKILDLDEYSRLDYSNPNIVKSTCLLPPPDAIMAEIDGDGDRFIWMYKTYLESEVPTEFIITMLAVLHRGFHIILYAPEISEDSIWINQLLNDFLMRFGIKVGTSENNNYEYNILFDSKNAELLYLEGFIDPYEFLTVYTEPLLPNVLQALYNDIKPLINPGDNVQAYFERMKIKLKVNPLSRDAVSFTTDESEWRV